VLEEPELIFLPEVSGEMFAKRLRGETPKEGKGRPDIIVCKNLSKIPVGAVEVKTPHLSSKESKSRIFLQSTIDQALRYMSGMALFYRRGYCAVAISTYNFWLFMAPKECGPIMEAKTKADVESLLSQLETTTSFTFQIGDVWISELFSWKDTERLPLALASFLWKMTVLSKHNSEQPVQTDSNFIIYRPPYKRHNPRFFPKRLKSWLDSGLVKEWVLLKYLGSGVDGEVFQAARFKDAKPGEGSSVTVSSTSVLKFFSGNDALERAGRVVCDF